MRRDHRREIELRNDLSNLYFACRYYIGILAELEQLGRTHTQHFKDVEKNVNALKHNIRRLEAELEAEEARVFDAELDDKRYLTAGIALA